MDHYAGIDVSLDWSSVCLADAAGRIVREARVASEPEALVRFFGADGTCRRLMTVPGVGALVAITCTSAVDDPARFSRSRTVGAHFGLTPKKKYQSGGTDVTGGISRVGGDALVRARRCTRRRT